MKANELRVGNWVKCINDDYDLFIRVRGITVRSNIEQPDDQPYGVYEYFLDLNDYDFLDTGKGFMSFVNYHRGVKSPEDIEPIPITEEWLLKLGFEKAEMDGEYWFEYHDTPLRLVSNDTSFNNNTDDWVIGFDFHDGDSEFLDNRIKYVHQLQNLFFALTGQELEIK